MLFDSFRDLLPIILVIGFFQLVVNANYVKKGTKTFAPNLSPPEEMPMVAMPNT